MEIGEGSRRGGETVKLREFVDRHRKDPRYIVTVWGAGYRFDGGLMHGPAE